MRLNERRVTFNANKVISNMLLCFYDPMKYSLYSADITSGQTSQNVQCDKNPLYYYTIYEQRIPRSASKHIYTVLIGPSLFVNLPYNM